MDNNQNNTFNGQQGQPQANPFGQQPQAGVFGQQPQQQAGVFGQQPQPQAGVFGQQGQPQAGVFGQQSQPQAGGVFGQQGQPQANPYGQQAGPYGQPPYKAPLKINIMELIAIICAGVSLIMVILGTILTCTCSATKSQQIKYQAGYVTSPVIALSICGVVVAIAAVVLGIMAIKNKNAVVKAGKISQIAVVIGCSAILIGSIPAMTVCGYNCSLQNAADANLNK